MRITSAANVLTPAYMTILAKGYTVRNEGELLVATRDGDTFIADDPILLLGVITIGESRGENWQATDAEIDEFVSKFGGSPP